MQLKQPSNQFDPMLFYMLKKMEKTIKFIEESNEIPICMLIKQEQRRFNMTHYELFNFDIELLRDALKFSRINSPSDPVLLHVARDVHIGLRLARKMQKLGGFVTKKMQKLGDFATKKRSNDMELIKIPCVLMTTRLSGGEQILLRDYMLRLY